MNFNFGEVLSRAWQIIWKHKVLWIFGILASCSQGGRISTQVVMAAEEATAALAPDPIYRLGWNNCS